MQWSQIDYSNPNAAEIVAFNSALESASTALEVDKKNKISNLQASHTTLEGKVTTAETKIKGFESFKQAQETTNAGVHASLSDLSVVKKKALDNATEFFQGNYIPTLSNEPASLWSTLDKCLEHEGDKYTVVVDANSPESAKSQNMFQYMFYRTTEGTPGSRTDFEWRMIGGGQFSELSVSVATLDHKITENDSDAHFKEKI